MKRILLFILSISLLPACQEKAYDYHFSEGGIGGEGWPVWGEYLIVNEAWQVPVGNLSGGEPDNIPRGSASALGHKPLPSSLRARWFSYRNQTFYEVTVVIPEAKQAEIKRWYKRYPTNVFLHKLSVGFAGQGELQAWWSVGCIETHCPEDLPERDHFELTPRVQATVAEGDPNQYRERTKGEVEEGSIPATVLERLPPEENDYSQDSELYQRIMHIVPVQ
ncbi:DUF2931 family protein [Gynuella sunshinyii]|uniref:DUF2931 family protein n=1 Tax=Gynuella sunshinyii YC6258 TaxID=1445510 RepID=A0A0C5V0X7_9GAMM|nr:DUF2931 family protein [Gynuella sunshinyii]AJQ93175.1 hypothetical Protein YC6258_01127 [Gynuella sunshinyii YC6258]